MVAGTGLDTNALGRVELERVSARARFVRACAGGANRVEAAAPRAPCRRLLWGAERAAGSRRCVRTCAPPMVHGRLGLD